MKIAIIFFIIFSVSLCHMSEEEIASTIDEKTITCGSALRIQNIMTKYQYKFLLIIHSLHSPRLQWGSGSRQQSVTSVYSNDDTNSVWVIKEKQGLQPCITGSPIRCGQYIRLEHANSGKNLHSHNYPSWITDSQEV